MNIKIKTILFLLCSTYYCNLLSLSKTNRTFYSIKPQNFNIPLELSLSYKQKYTHKKYKYKSFLDVTQFYFKTFGNLDSYFLFEGKDKLKIGTNTDVDHTYLKFNETDPNSLSGQLKLHPKQKTYGAYVNYFVQLDPYIKRGNLYISTYICQTIFRPYFKISNSIASSSANKTIASYFNGEPMFQVPEEVNDEPSTPRNLQTPLEYGKISGPKKDMGLANITVQFGYDVIQNETCVLRLSSYLLIPTNRESSAIFLFEPRLGTANHWGLGFGISGKKTILDENIHNFDLAYDSRFYYLFSATERRILGLKNVNNESLNWGQYLLFGEADASLVLPAANVLAQNVKIFPGCVFEGAVMFAYNYGHCTFNFGYDLFLRQSEKARKKDLWNNSMYGLVGSDFANNIINFNSTDNTIRANSVFGLNYTNLTDTINQIQLSGATPSQQGFIQSSQLDTKPAQTPSMYTNTFFVAIGYTKETKNNTFVFGGGASIEVGFNHNAFNTANLWLKAAVTF